jgi:two-component system, sensor histidine kinase
MPQQKTTAASAHHPDQVLANANLSEVLAHHTVDPASLRRGQMVQVRQSLWVALTGTSIVCLVFAALQFGRGFDDWLWLWLAMGACTAALRAGLWWRYRGPVLDSATDTQVRLFLRLTILAAHLAGWMFAVAWLGMPEHLDTFDWVALLAANLALLFGGLFAYGSCLPAFLAFAMPSIGSAIVGLWSLNISHREIAGSTLALGMVLIVSTLFAWRSDRAFRINHGLRQRVMRLFEEVTQKKDEAVSATLAKSRFLASVSHDLRQPLHAINLYLSSLSTSHERMLAKPEEPEHARAVQAGLASLRESALYLNSMFESLLDISRLDAGTVAVDVRPVSLVKLIGQLESDYQKLAQTEGLTFDVRLPSQFKLMEVQTDPALLERLLRNLIVNAFRYTEKGGVRLSVVARGRMLDFRVVDTGPGIERGMRRRIFEEFFQVPGSQAKVQRQAHTGRGIGLGLAISARLADKLGTHIRLTSLPGHGSVFALRQPMRLALRAPVESGSGLGQGAGGPFPAGTFLVVIDDDLEIRRSSQLMLEQMGAEVFSADSGANAIGPLGRMGRLPSVILCDYRLTEENGLDVIQALRDEFNEDIPAILITGDTSPEHVTEFREAGVNVLHKPIPGDVLLAAIHQELARVSPQLP